MDNNGRRKRCSIKNCTSSGVRLFRFPNPKNEQRVIQWKIACGDENIMKKEPSVLYSTNRICSNHFEAMYMNGHNLNKAAIPTLNLFLKPQTKDIATQTENLQQILVLERQIVKVPEEHIQKEHVQIQTTQDLSANSPRKSKLRMLLKEKNRKIKQLNTKIMELQQMNSSQGETEEICLIIE
ncbi:uncharacterized protein LOC123313188 [Coccinella septempunctata]|uniref:uncharacterized protein LOC123313188 n=1 Tax=Coccinella septempunctata TaxID=41139 RepID=UPI001D0755DE|nr:uncharacterized protein LOC123313188 [Coccinella septempunctata]